MIEKKILDYLTDALTCSVAMERDGQTAPFVLIEKTGSSFTNYINRATLAFQSHAGTLYDAADLNETVKSAVFSLVEHDDIYSVKLVNDYNFTDTTKKEYRYQAIFDFFY